jgi:hypothetical protein
MIEANTTQSTQQTVQTLSVHDAVQALSDALGAQLDFKQQLRKVHTMLRSNSELVHLLSDDELQAIYSGLDKLAGSVLTQTVTATKPKKQSKKAELQDSLDILKQML